MQLETLTARLPWALPISLMMLLMAGCAGTGVDQRTGESDLPSQRDYGDSRTFPVPPEIQGNVDFWRHVYGVWSRGEVAIHDEEHIGVIYEVAKIPGPIKAGYTASQESWLKGRMDYHKRRLDDLEQRVRADQRLAESDRELLDKFKQAGGVGALYGASERVRAQRGVRERFRRGVEISGRYDQSFREIMRRHGVPEDLAYLPHVESSFQTNARSSVGAGGVWQFMPSTGRQYMTISGQVDERFDPILAADGAARYLSQAYQRLGSWPLAITSYNHGQGGMAKARSEYGNDIGRIVKNYKGPAFGFASRNFYSEFVAAREVASHADRYFPEGVRYEEPWLHDRLVLRDSMPAHHLARHYGTSKHQLADLNLHWRDSVVKGDGHLPPGSTVWLPQGTTRRIASHPPPVQAPVLVARVEPRAAKPLSAPARTAVAKVGPTTKPVTATSKPVTKPVIAKTKPRQEPSQVKARYHVVKPQETLYRVAVQNGISVDELRKLNKMRPNDNNIRPGQKLIVGI
ncbi:lytic transglycosylase domain-containing protein [Thiocystis violacea]|uniref:lytic transglycosylase domain-containing protein n=1 Tax=Thiocystis violacea TaxID=13725 RepID=UPI0019060C64|nr:lytic transglycosylase domain-containing protein [Thiocystis violacea]MBK1716805.1 lytic transglycosylase [Thiocystis violacea]